MNANIALTLVVAALVGGCSDSPSDKLAGGGFETSDIQVALTDSLGQKIVGARLWLIKNSSDSVQPTKVLDSSTSDDQGRATVRTEGYSSDSLGLEAWVGDTLVGFLPRIDSNTPRPLPLKMRRPRVLTLPCGPYMVVLPGSHFQQGPPPTCMDSFFVLLPPGDWKLFTVNLLGPPMPMPFPVKSDSLPMWYPPPPTDGGPMKPGPYPPPYQPAKR